MVCARKRDHDIGSTGQNRTKGSDLCSRTGRDTDDRDKHSREEAAEIVLNPVEGVRYTVPSTINPVHMDENLTVRFRVGGVYKNCYVSVYFDEERVIHKKRPVVAPGEMEQIKLTKEQLMKYPGLKTITVKIEEA